MSRFFALTPPAFWYAAGLGWQARLLSPLAALYALAGVWRQKRAKPWRGGVPVLCIGNLVAGGAGKTPVALAIAEGLAVRHGITPIHFLTRGFKGTLTQDKSARPVRVNPACHGAAEVGDEALLLAAAAPTWVARDRVAGAKAAAAAGARLIILDDGFQNPSLFKDFSLLVMDARAGFGNGKVIPAGPLRESLRRGLARATAVVRLDGGDGSTVPVPLALEQTMPVLRARLEAGAALSGQRLLAFAGIGRPEKFFATLKGLGAELAASVAFADHHPYSEAEIAALKAQAAAMGAILITTTKDMARLSSSQRQGIRALPVRVTWEDEAALASALAPLLSLLSAQLDQGPKESAYHISAHRLSSELDAPAPKNPQ